MPMLQKLTSVSKAYHVTNAYVTNVAKAYVSQKPTTHMSQKLTVLHKPTQNVTKADDQVTNATVKLPLSLSLSLSRRMITF